MSNKLPISYFNRDAISVAKDLLGKKLVRRIDSQLLTGYITETEAYLAQDDPASHFCRYKNPPSEFLQGPGTIYVYRIYGIYCCLNIITGLEDQPGAVLIRAITPQSGLDRMAKNRGMVVDNPDLTNGPGKICQALAIDTDHSASSINGSNLYLTEGVEVTEKMIHQTTRIGISQAKDLKLRFVIKTN